MAGRYLNRLVGAEKFLLSNKSSAGNLMRLLCTTTTATTTTATTTTTTTTTTTAIRCNSTVRSVSTPTFSSSSLRSWSPYDYVRKPYFSVDFLNMYPLLEQPLEEKLPVMCRTLRSGDSSLLQRYCCPKEEIVDIKVALENELVAMCVLFLFIDVPAHVKKGVVWGMKDICYRTSEAATNMHIHEERVRDAPTHTSSDEEFVNALVVDVLCSKNEEVLRQVCSILGIVATCRLYQTINFGNGIQKELVQLSRIHESPVLVHILFAINRISLLNKGMKHKFIEAELSDGVLRRILRREGHCDFSLEAEAYNMVHTIARAHCSDELWKYVMEHLMPAVVDRCFVCDIDVKRTGAHVISSFIAKASPRYIKELVDLGCLKTLIRLLTSDDATIKRDCFEAVETILSLGDADPSKNKHAKTIDDLTKEWRVFYVNNPQKYKDIAKKGSYIVKTYRPNKHPVWLKQYLDGWVS